MSLRRAVADWPIVVAAFLTMLLATTLLAAGPIYSSAVSVAGLRQLLAEASIEAGNVRVSAGVPLAQLDAVDQAISAELSRVTGPQPSELARFGTGDTFALPGQGSEVRDLAVAGFAENIEQHATLVSGAWPAPRQAATAQVEVAITDAVAEQLQLAVGDRLELTNRRDAQSVLPITIAAVFQIDDPGDPYWWADARTFDGLTESDQYRTFGPFVMNRADLLERAVLSSVSMQWRLMPSFDQIAIEEVPGFRARVAALPDRLRQVAGQYTPTVVTELPQTLASAGQALLVSRTGMLLVMAQLAVLGGYAILLTAGLLIDHRRVETALLRSRGAGAGHVAMLALVEGLVLAIPAVLLGPWLAVAALGLFDVVGPLAQVGLSVPLRITSDAYLAAGVAGAACVALLCLPALFSARSFTAEEQSLSREETRPLAQRLGIDIALLAIAAVAVWQLRLYGGPLTRTLQGTLGPDPLLIAAPALGLLLGAVIATRLLPRLAEAAQGLSARGKGLVGALGSFQLARRPLRYTRSALMLMLAMSIGVFAVSYATTWTDSQRSQAEHQVGADAVVAPSQSVRSLPPWSLSAAYSQVPGVDQATAVERSQIRVGDSVRATLLALDAGAISEMVRFRPDQAASSLTELLNPLSTARPAVGLVDLPEGSTELIVTPAMDIRSVERFVVDPATEEITRQAEDPQAFDTAASIGLSVAVRDAHGLIHRIAAVPSAPETARQGISIPLSTLTSARDGALLPPDGPLELVSLDLNLALPSDVVVTDASFSIAGISSRIAEGAGERQVDLGDPSTWRMAWLDATRVPTALSPTPGERLGFGVGADADNGAPPELATDGVRPVTISMQPGAISALAADEIPVVVNQSTVAATALDPGETLHVDVAGAVRRLRIVGVVDSFPTTDATTPLVIADLPTLAVLRMQAAHALSSSTGPSGDNHRPDEWWLDLSAGSGTIDGEAAALADDVSRTLAAPPFSSVSVTTLAGRLRSLLSDPVAVGIIGALSLGAIAAALFALIGLAVAASVSARQRQNEFALMRALGLSRRQLSGWLWLENGSLAVVSVLIGTALGALISWVVLPTVTVTPDGQPPTPPVVVTMPLPTIVILGLIAAFATAVLVVIMAAALRRTGIGNILRASGE